MIKILNNKNRKIAEVIRAVFQTSYAVEAKLLKAIDISPFKKTSGEFYK